MTSTIKVNNIQNQCGANIINESSNTITLGASGDTIALASGASQTGFGRTGTVDWNTTPKTSTFTAVSGDGFFANTSGGAFTMNLPSGSAGSIVSVADYAGTWQTNALTVAPNGSDKIGSVNASVVLNTQGQSVTFVFVDSTQGWLVTDDGLQSRADTRVFISATGGTIATVDTNFKTHTFTGPGTFAVTAVGIPAVGSKVSYTVVAGGGGGGNNYGGGGGGGGFREGKQACGSYTASPLAATPCSGLAVSVQSYPIIIGAGGVGGTGPSRAGGTGTVSTFSSITSAGGGGGAGNGEAPGGLSGGSGGGGSGPCTGAYVGRSGGSGNTPPVSPPQGNAGVTVNACQWGGAGGGATAAGSIRAGGAGATNTITGSPVGRAGGGGGGPAAGAGPQPGAASASDGGGAYGTAGTANTGGGGGSDCAAAGGSGVVVIRYKFQ